MGSKIISALLGAVAVAVGPAASATELVKGEHAILTEDAATAYYQALAFCHGEIENPIQFTYPQVREALVAGFKGLDADTQKNLASSRAIVNYYAIVWDDLSLEDKLEFGYAVFSLAYGEKGAEQLLAPFMPSASGRRTADDIVGSVSLDVASGNTAYGDVAGYGN